MSDQPVEINARNAGLFSAAAYTPIGEAVNTGQLPGSVTQLPPGWTEFTTQAISIAQQFTG